jgi:hypothetical protein
MGKIEREMVGIRILMKVRKYLEAKARPNRISTNNINNQDFTQMPITTIPTIITTISK